MKHLKTFENVENFKIGDIVAKYDDKTSKWYTAQLFRIEDISMGGACKIVHYDPNDDNFQWLRLEYLRFATPEEIEKWNLTIQTDKYNL